LLSGERCTLARMLRQLSFDVAPHPHAAARPDGGWMDGSLEITVTVANADGEVIDDGP
jgi:hypothetical protein